MSKTLAEKIKKGLTEVIDRVTKDEFPEKKDDDKAKDAEIPGGGAQPSVMDELVQICDKLKGMMDAMSKKEEEKPVDAKPEVKPEEKAADEPVEASLEERLKALEMAVSKLLESKSAVAGDDDEEAEEEVSDEEEEEVIVGDTSDEVSRAEILAPGIKETKDLKKKALKACYATKDGKAIIEALNDGKVPDFDSKEKVATLFVSASEVLMAKRGTELSRTKVTDFQSSYVPNSKTMTPEKMNEINAQIYKLK